jgi:hypothetical protein
MLAERFSDEPPRGLCVKCAKFIPATLAAQCARPPAKSKGCVYTGPGHGIWGMTGIKKALEYKHSSALFL